MDALSEVMKAIKVEGAVVYNAEFSSPWNFRVPPSHAAAASLEPGKVHIVIFHFLLEGRAQVKMEDGQIIRLASGDVVIFPQGESHILQNSPQTAPVYHEADLPELFAKGPRLVRRGGGGEITRFVSGYIACDSRSNTELLKGLPSTFKVNIRDGARGRWIEDSICFWVKEAENFRSGDDVVISRLSEALFVEILRRYIAVLPAEQTGWLAGSRDPDIGKTLALMHSRPEHGWTLADLAKCVGTSRSALAKRFTQFLGKPPMSYLTQWRLQLAAKLLTSTNHSVLQIAFEVGYESESAFNRAFKRQFGLPPARYRLSTRVSQTNFRAQANAAGD